MHQPLLGSLDAWIDAQPKPKPSRPEAVRRLLIRGPAAENPAAQVTPGARRAMAIVMMAGIILAAIGGALAALSLIMDAVAPLTAAQCRAARALIAMSQSDLARARRVPVASIADFETGAWLRPEDRDAIQHALELAGVEFIEGGVREKDG